MNRRKAREYALQMLFQHEFSGHKKGQKPPEDFWAGSEESGEAGRFAERLVRGALEHIEEIDGAIQKAAEHWDMKRMAAVDRNILRFAVYEILYAKDIPPAVTINEALEIAKKYSSLESASFINGLLDKIAHDFPKT
ncbi:MAG: transcription antitermination factor NusB [Candidatus Sulfobium sp.]|jgi:N utilization substance protein B